MAERSGQRLSVTARPHLSKIPSQLGQVKCPQSACAGLRGTRTSAQMLRRPLCLAARSGGKMDWLQYGQSGTTMTAGSPQFRHLLGGDSTSRRR